MWPKNFMLSMYPSANTPLLCKVSGALLTDPGPLDSWLNRPLPTLRFEETIDSMTVKVLCDLIPDVVRDILPKYSDYKAYRLFQEIFHANIIGKESWKEIVQTLQEAMDRYDELAKTIFDGKRNI